MSFFIRTLLVLIGFLCLNPGFAAFKLGAESVSQEYKPSNIGIIGLRYIHRQGEMSTVVQIYPGTPAARSGVQVGDRILAVDGTPIVTFNADQVFGMIAGRPGTTVALKMLRCNRNYGTHMGCEDYQVSLRRMEMNDIASDNIFNVYKYSN